MPLGAGALAGVNFLTDRDPSSPASSASSGVAENSMDAVSNRDFVLDYLSARATCSTHLSQLGAEIVLWSSQEFGFCEPPDAFASGSVDHAPEEEPRRRRAACARRRRAWSAHFVHLQGVLHGLPLTYNKDLQEDKEPLFDAVDTLELTLSVAREMVRTLDLRPRAPGRRGLRRVPRAPRTSPTCSCAAACRSASRTGWSAGSCGALSSAAGSCPTSPTPTSPSSRRPSTAWASTRCSADGAWLESKVSEGGTSLERVREQLGRARTALDEAAA